MSRACDAINCERVVQTGRFMCIHHWRLVPVAEQRQINARYRAASSRYALMHDVFYVQACATAIEHVAALEGHPTANSYRNLLGLLQRQQKGA